MIRLLFAFFGIGILFLLHFCHHVSSFELKNHPQNVGGETLSRRELLKSATSTFAAGVIISTSSSPASAYERRDVGDETSSAATKAMNIQAYKTNSRLEQSGFKLDTREEEQARLSSAMASFSYDTATTKPKSGYKKK